MHGLFAAKSGWGKGWHLQAWMETNAPRYKYFVCLDYADEFRGLVKSGLATHYIVGPREAEAWGVKEWKQAIRQNPRLILARHHIKPAEWRENVAAPVIQALQELAHESEDASALGVIDEAHWVAPQKGSVPDPVEEIATSGRSEGLSTMWATQRLTKLEEDVLGQMMFQIIGGYTSSGDLGKVASAVEYPDEIHNPQTPPSQLSNALPDALQVDGETVPLRRFTEGEGDDERTIGSEWVFSDDSGEIRRIDTREVEMEATHYGDEGMKLVPPDEG